jgi:thiol-disulfide isomerase/thioredoxin
MKIHRTVLAALFLAAPAGAQPKWFAPDAASQQSLADSLAAAQKSNHRLLVMYAGSWCNLCDEVHGLAMSDPDVPKLVHSGYELAHVTVEDFAGLTQFAQQTLHAKLDKSNALLISVLEPDGGVVATLTAGRLMDSGHLSAAKLKAQLSEFLIGAPASEVYRTALASLPDGKAGWVEFRADWCGWCKKMEKFFGATDAAPVLAKYYTVIAIDTEKNRGADELAKSLGAPEGVEGGGIPWFAAVDPKGKVLATSEGPKGNIGYPDSDVEVAHFMTVMKTTARGITADELDTIANTIKALKAKDAPATGNH